jgi:hypothetical protein
VKLSWTWDPGKQDVIYIGPSGYIRLMSRILVTELCFQWEPGIMLNALMDAMSGKLSSYIHLAQQLAYLHRSYLQALREQGKCIIVLMYMPIISIYLDIRLAIHVLYKQGDPGACCSLQLVARNIQYMLALIGNVDVVRDSTRLRPTNVEIETFSITVGHSPIVHCQRLNISLKFALGDVLEDASYRLVVSFSCTSDYGYEFYSSKCPSFMLQSLTSAGS